MTRETDPSSEPPADPEPDPVQPAMERFLDDAGIEYRKDVDMSACSVFRMGSTARTMIVPAGVEQLASAAAWLRQNRVAFKVIGATSNILFRDDAEYPVLLTLRKLRALDLDPQETTATVGAGTMLPGLVKNLAERSVTGFEGLEGIPGTVGGAVYMNAAAFGDAISDSLVSVDVLGPDGRVVTYAKAELGFSYRHSRFNDETLGVILSARFALRKGRKDLVQARIRACHTRRMNLLEYNHPNLGSTFATRDIYREIGRRHPLYLVLYTAARVARKALTMATAKGSYRLWNRFTCLYFGLAFSGRQPFSDRTMNCVINNGHTTREILEYIERIQALTGNALRLEIEILGETR